MNIICAKDYNDMSCKAADIISNQIIEKENSILGLATGETVLGIYKQLTDRYRSGDLSFSNVRSFNLDEYAGLAPEHPNSYHRYMDEEFFRHVDLNLENCHIPNGMANSTETECRRYDQLILKLGGIDLQLLGLGMNGHIGFNEPEEFFAENTHLVKLSENTRLANSRFFPSLDEVPTHAITMGIRNIMQSRRILLCVSGESKARILREVLFGPITPYVPGSILQTHPQLTVIADKGARKYLL